MFLRRHNLGILAHVDAGKTTLTERILLATGRIHATGEVDDGDTALDFDPQERKRGITISAAATTVEHAAPDGTRHALTIVDTPGHVDFTIEVERALRVLDGAVVVLDASQGVEPQTETVWRQADRHAVPRIAFANKLDKVGASLQETRASVKARLGVRTLALCWPLFEGGKLVGIVDLVGRRVARGEREGERGGERGRERAREQVSDAPPSDAMERARVALVEDAATVDDALLAEALAVGSEAVSAASLWAALARITHAQSALPLLAGSAQAHLGVVFLLDAVVALLPTPEQLPAVVGEDAAGRSVTLAPDRAAPLSALVFKVVHDPERGALAFVRVYSGVLSTGDKVAVGVAGKRTRVGRLVQVHADQLAAIDEIAAGDIGAVVGARELRTGDTLSALSQPVVLGAIVVPSPVMSVSLTPATRAQLDALDRALARLVADDPTLTVSTDPESGSTLLHGMGELHLEVTVERLRTTHGVDVRVGTPQVAWRETLAGAARVDHKLVQQNGGTGLWAHVVLEVAPGERGTGLVFEDATRGGVIPREWVRATEVGVRSAMARGVRTGHPLVDVRVRLVDGGTHVKDSSAAAFTLAARRRCGWRRRRRAWCCWSRSRARASRRPRLRSAA